MKSMNILFGLVIVVLSTATGCAVDADEEQGSDETMLDESIDEAADVEPEAIRNSCGTCIRAIYCVAQCGGPVVQAGCCACPAGTFDKLQCSSEI